MAPTIQILNTDCLTGFLGLESKSISCIVTSPPYNSHIKYGKYKDNLKEVDYLEFIDKVLKECKRVLKDDGCLFWNISAKPSNQGLQFDVVNLVRKYFYIQNTIHWIKSIHVDKKTHGHVKPIQGDRYLNPCHEFIIQAVREPIKLNKLGVGVPYTDKSNIKRWKNKQDLRDRGNTWYIPYSTVKKGKTHPAGYPLQLPINCLKLYGLDKINLVVDPFIGEGTTALACQQLGLSCIGFEIDKVYVDIALVNLAKIK